MVRISDSQIKECKFYDPAISSGLINLYIISRCFDKTSIECNLPRDCFINADNINLIYENGQPKFLPNNDDIRKVLAELSAHDFKTPPNIFKMARNLGSAIRATNFETVSPEVYNLRDSICKSCPFWNDKARFGAGMCSHPRCGCTRAKHHLKSSKCPILKW